MAKLIKGTHHVAIKCKDDAMFDEVIRFYTEILGLDLLRSWDGGAMIDTGNSVIEVFAAGMIQDQTGSINHFALETDDVDLCIETVRKAGYTITVEPKDVDIPSNPVFPVRVGFCVGPAGEEVEFFKVY